MIRLATRVLLAALIVPLFLIFLCGQLLAQQTAKAEKGEDVENARAEKGSAENKTLFTRIRKDKDGKPVAFETAIIRYAGENEKGEKFTVDLIGAVHIGEKEYYEALNKEFEQYESLLYELVAPKGTRIEKGKKRDTAFSAVSSFQRGMKNMLGLDFQLDHVDYTKDNFVHADMSPEEFSKSMKANDESMLKIIFKMMGHGMGAQGSEGMISDADILAALFASDRELQMKRLLATQLQNGDAMLSVFEGKDGSTIITHRNKKALEVLKDELGKGKTNLGIFYGAGHFPEMEASLIKDFRVKKAGEKWVTAWSLVDPVASKKSRTERQSDKDGQ